MPTSLQNNIDRANPNSIADQFRLIKLGQTLRQDVKLNLRKLNPNALGVGPEDLATLHAVVLPNDAKAGIVLRAFARAGGVTGELTVAARHATPSTGQIGVSPAGNIVVLAADAITNLDVVYLPERGDVYQTVQLPVTTHVLTLPAALSGKALTLIRAEAITGTVTGRKKILAPGAGAPAAGQARLNIAGTTVTFNSGTDVVTAAVVTVQIDAAAEPATLLAADSNLI